MRISDKKADLMVAFTFVVKKEGKSWHAARVAAETEDEGEAIEATADDTYRFGMPYTSLCFTGWAEPHSACTAFAGRHWH